MKRPILLSLAILLLSLTGCRHCCRRPICGGRSDLPPRGGFLETPTRSRGDARIPPPGLSTRPESLPDVSAPPPSITSEPLPSRYYPPVAPQRPRETLYPEGWLEEPAYPKKPATSEPPAVLSLPDLPVSQSSSAKPATPAGYTERINPTGLPHFLMVVDRVASGRKPNVEGFDTLRNAGFKKLIYLHDAGKDISPVKELAEKKGFEFQGIPTSASNLKAAFSPFAEAVGDKKQRPVFFFDDDGARTGALWYVYFRKIESINDDAAQVKAGPLGLRETGEERNRFWQAAQDEVARK